MTTESAENNPSGDGESEPWVEPTDRRTPLAQDRPPKPEWVRYLALSGLGLLMLVLLGWGILQLTSSMSNSIAMVAEDSHSSPRTPSAAKGDLVPVPTPPVTVIATDQAVRRAAVLEAQADVQAAQKLLSRLTKQQDQWQELAAPLGESEAGRRIASDLVAVKMFAAAQNRERITSEATASLRQSLFALAAPVETAMADEEAVLDLNSGFSEQLQSISTQLATGLKQWQDDNVLVRLLISESKGREPSESTLTSKIETFRAEEIRQRAVEIAAKVEAGEDALDQQEVESKLRLKELATDKQLAVDAVEAKREAAKIASLKAEELALADQIAAARTKAELERKFQADLPEIRVVLTPFITPGHKQLVNGRWTYLEEKQPLSLSGIIAARTLGEDGLSCQRLCHLGGGSKNDRPNGSFRSYIGGAMRPGDMPNVRKVQRLLLTYGDLMVEKGLLMP